MVPSDNDHHRSLRLGRVLGVEIFVHYSWLLIVVLILLSFWGQLDVRHPTIGEPERVTLAVLGAVLFFGSVLLHELAHALVAKRRGFEVKGITLYFFGGATEADTARRSAVDEFLVAIVGPLTSLGIAVLLAVAAVMGDQGQPLPEVLAYLAAINLVLAVFNMAPGLPLDGGRVLRSLVWHLTDDFSKATRWATTAGVAIGYLVLSGGLLFLWRGNVGGLWLAAIGWMISQSARQNQQQEGLRWAFEALVAADIMSSPVVTIPADTSIAHVVRDYFAKHEATAFPVVDGTRICGLLSVATVKRIPEAEIWKTTAGEVVSGRPEHAPALIGGQRTPMIEVIAALSADSKGKSRALVVEQGQIIGIISPSDIIRRYRIAGLVGPALSESQRLPDS